VFLPGSADPVMMRTMVLTSLFPEAINPDELFSEEF
jgi:hypothetical protein